MEQELTVACVYWKGKFRGRENHYTEQWVERLASMVRRHLHVPYRFVCLTNTDKDIQVERRSLLFPERYVGWWAKLELFRPGALYGRILYLDLDLLVMKDLQPFVDFPAGFATLPAFGKPSGEPGTVFGINSSVMAFDAELGQQLWGLFHSVPDVIMNKYRGDQDFIYTYGQHFMKLFPKQWVTKLRYLEDESTPDPAAKIILCMPGKNDRAAEKHKWIREVWS